MPRTRSLSLALITLTAALPACLPSRVVLDLAPQTSKLAETEVIHDDALGTFSPKVALIDVEGVLGFSASSSGLFAGRANAVDELVARLERAENDGRVEAVVLRINSPGGTVASSETMYREVRRFREKTGKPVVVSMAEVAASGGYYLSLAADRVLAQESTITGSIGVIFQTLNFSRGMGMIGIEGRAVTSAKNKDIANPLAPPRDEHYAILQSTVDEFYKGFRNLVKERRTTIAPDRFDELTDGRIMTGKQALDAGLVDELGGVREAFAAAKSLAGITKARLVKYHGPADSPMSPYGASSGTKAPTALAGTSVDVSLIDAPSSSSVPRGQFLYLWHPESN
jgi:protease-4